MSRIRILQPLGAALVVLAALVAVGCQGELDTEGSKNGDAGQEQAEPEVIEKAEVEPSVADGKRLPLELMVQMSPPGEAQPTRTLDEAREVLADDPELEPLKEALAAGGWSDEQAAQMVYFAGAHNSGQPEDSVRARQERLYTGLMTALMDFNSELTAYEQEHNVRIDRQMLRELGILTGLQPTDEQ